jgi:hypothetical protein
MKTTADCYTIRANGEWGTFYVREGVDDGGHHWCELTCNTAFGCVGHYWGSMGRPAPKFLAKVDKGYLLGKLWGTKTKVFDPGAAISDAKRALFAMRRAADISAVRARDVYDDICNAEPDEHGWHLLVDECEWLYDRMVDGASYGMVPNPQAEGFWRDLWPTFIAELTATDGVPGGMTLTPAEIEKMDPFESLPARLLYALCDAIREAKPVPLVPCPVCGGEAVHALDMLRRTVIQPVAEISDERSS